MSLAKVRQAASLLRELMEAWPRRKGLARAVREVFLEAGLPRRQASLLARLLAPEGPLSEEGLRRGAGGELAPEEREGLLRALEDGRGSLELLASGASLAVVLGEVGLPEPSPPPAYPSSLAHLRPFLREGGVFLLQGLPFRERYRLGLALAEALAHLWGLEGAFLGTVSAAGAGRLLDLLGERWEGFAARAGAFPFLPGEAPSWLEGPGQALLSPFAVGPVDHALRAVTRAPESLLRLALLMRKVPVLAVPEEDPLLFTALLLFLRWARALGRPVLLLSPALPRGLLAQLGEALSLKLPRHVPLPSLLQLLPGEAWELPVPPWGRLLTVEEALPERGGLFFPTREAAREAYLALTRGASLEEAGEGYLLRVLRDGRRVLLLHGGLPLLERRRRERGEADLVVGTFWGAGEGLEAPRMALVAPTPLAAKEALLQAQEGVTFLPGEPPKGRPKALFAHALPPKGLLRLPEDLALLDPSGNPEVQAWWERGRAEGEALLEAPESFPSGHLPRVALRRGAPSVFLLPPEGKEGGAFLLRRLAEERYGPLPPGEWVLPVPRPLPREVGL